MMLEMLIFKKKNFSRRHFSAMIRMKAEGQFFLEITLRRRMGGICRALFFLNPVAKPYQVDF